MQNRYSLPVLLAVFSIGQIASAMCVFVPPIRADVTIDGCLAVAFSSSHSQLDVGAGSAPVYRDGASYSGTFLRVTIKSSAYVSQKDGQGPPWAAGDRQSLFVHGPPDLVCPSQLSADVVTVTTEARCCDQLPIDGSCLVPIPIVTVSKGSRHAAP
jgi:hypothetical protein